jgi:hypothetical protein
MYLEKVQIESVEAEVCEPFQPRRALPTGAVALLNQSAVQEELKLTAAHKQTILEIAQQRRSLSRQIRQGNLDTCQSELENIASLEHHLILNLSPGQSERLDQLVLQVRGPLSFQIGEVCNALDFDETQNSAISSLLEKLEAKQSVARMRGNDDSTGEMDAFTSDIKRQLLNFLTIEQKTRWRAMQGVPFDFDRGHPFSLVAEASE